MQGVVPGMAPCCFEYAPRYNPQDWEQYEHFDENPVKLAREQPVSTFSIDVDTGSYANVRRFLNEGSCRRKDAVRVEEMHQLLRLRLPGPRAGRARSRPTGAGAGALESGHPAAPDRHQRLRGASGTTAAGEPGVPHRRVRARCSRPTSCRCSRTPMRLLTRQLRARDRVSMVVYAGGGRRGPAADARRPPGRDPRCSGPTRSGREHQRRGRHPARLRSRPPGLHQGRHQSRAARAPTATSMSGR